MTRRIDGVTGDLFSTIPSPAPQIAGAMNYRTPVSNLISQMLRDAMPTTRYAIAGRMSELADVETSKAILDSYCAESREECNLPLWKAPLIEVACNSRILAEWHAAVLGGKILWGAEVMDADIGKRERLIGDLQLEVRALKQRRRVMR